MKHWTVLGYYEDNRQCWANGAVAEDYETAEGLARREMAEGLYEQSHDSLESQILQMQHDEDPEDHEKFEAEIRAEWEQDVVDIMDDQIISVGVVEGKHNVLGGTYPDGDC
jgi:hypothetical protein